MLQWEKIITVTFVTVGINNGTVLREGKIKE
jgi:hypothetical protein